MLQKVKNAGWQPALRGIVPRSPPHNKKADGASTRRPLWGSGNYLQLRITECCERTILAVAPEHQPAVVRRNLGDVLRLRPVSPCNRPEPGTAKQPVPSG